MRRWPTRPGCGSPTPSPPATSPRRNWPTCSRCRPTCSPTTSARARAGRIVTRRRSEGDRRRTYLQLVPGALDSLAPPGPRRAAGAIRMHRQLRPLAPGGRAVAAGQHRSGDIRWNASGSGDRSRCHRRGHASQFAAAPAAAPPTSARSRHDGDLVVTVCDLAHEELAEAAAVHWSIPGPGPVRRPGQLRRGTGAVGRPRSGAWHHAWQPSLDPAAQI